MKKTILFFGFCLFLSACGLPGGGTNSFISGTSQPKVNNTPAPPPTITQIPTVTVDYQNTAVVAQLTADAAVRLMIEVTAAEEQRLHEEAGWAFAEEQMDYQRDSWTATQAPTSFPITLTAIDAAKTAAADARTALAATINAPTNVVAIANAKVEAELAESTAKVNLFIKFASGFLALCLGFVCLWVVFAKYPTKEKPLELKNLNADLTPYTPPEEKNPNQLIRAVIPCPKDIFLEFADGVVNRNMTPGFNSWEGTSVHKWLKQIREFLDDHKLAKYVRNSGGMMDVLAKGEEFLTYTWEKKEPPFPYIFES